MRFYVSVKFGMDQRRELEGMLNAAESRQRPAFNYERMSAEEFVYIWHYSRCVETFSVMLVACSAGRDLCQPSKELDAMYDAPLTREKVITLAEWYYNPMFFLLLAERVYEQPYIIKDLERRLSEREITKNLVIIPKTVGMEGNLPYVEKLLRVDKIKAFPATIKRGYDSNDLKSLALTEAVETIEGKTNIKSATLPRYPLRLPPDFQEIWEQNLGELWKQMENSFGQIKAGLELRDEVVHQKVRDHLRNLYRTAFRQTKIFEGTEDFPEAGAQSWRADWDFSKAAMRDRAQKIERETTSLTLNPEEQLQEKEAQKEALKETLKLTTWAYEIAAKRSGKKGIAFIEGLKAGKTELEASREAKISDRTGRRILESIRESHPRKSPQKTGR